MAVTRHKHTRSSVGQRRMHIYTTPGTLTTCQKCKAPVRAHAICRKCGYYKGKEVINVLGAMTKKERKLKEKEFKQVEKEDKKNASMTMEGMSKK